MRRALILALGLCATSSFAVRLTGLNGSPTDAQGNWHTGWYNTYGGNGDTGKNAYVILGDNPNGNFVNSGNTTQSTAINVDLTQPGQYKFLAFFDGSEIYAGRDYWSLNLFFDGNNVNPAISVYARPSAGLTPQQVWLNTGRQVSVDAKNQVFGSGRDTYANVRLTDFATFKDPYSIDRVNNFNLGASGRNDHVAAFTLEVVPEPGTVTALAIGSMLLLRKRRRAR